MLSCQHHLRVFFQWSTGVDRRALSNRLSESSPDPSSIVKTSPSCESGEAQCLFWKQLLTCPAFQSCKMLNYLLSPTLFISASCIALLTVQKEERPAKSAVQRFSLYTCCSAEWKSSAWFQLISLLKYLWEWKLLIISSGSSAFTFIIRVLRAPISIWRNSFPLGSDSIV